MIMVSTISLHRVILGCLLLLSFLQGCVMNVEPVPEDRYYRLKVLSDVTPLSNPIFEGIIEVERFVADGVTAGRPIVYSEINTQNQLQEYHYHFWTEPPTIMLRDELVDFLRTANIATSVVTPEMRIRSNFAVTGKINRLEQIVGNNGSTVIELELSLRRPDTGELILLKTYNHQILSEKRGIMGAVASLNAALSQIYLDFLKDLINV